jgi:hypothetical protein
MQVASILMVGGATWIAWQNSGDTGWFVVLVGGGLATVGGLLVARNAQQCSEESGEAEGE